MARWGVLALLIALLSGQAFAAAADDVAATFDRAEIWIKPPGGPFFNGRLEEPDIARLLAAIPADTRLPTVVLMHGCSPKKGAAWTYARWFAGQGFAAIIPDSFQRRGRPATCNPGTLARADAATADAVHVLRLEEIAYAAQRVRALPFVDAENLFLLGDDEGGDAVANYAGGGFVAYIVAGTGCRYGIRVHGEAPLLALTSRGDPHLGAVPPDGCRRMAEAQGRAVEAVVLPGFWHDVSGMPEARAAIQAFIGRHRTGGD